MFNEMSIKLRKKYSPKYCGYPSKNPEYFELRWDLVDCILGCEFCSSPASRPKKMNEPVIELTPAQIFCDTIKNIKKPFRSFIRFTGGEPTLYWKELLQVFEFLATDEVMVNIPILIQTNGISIGMGTTNLYELNRHPFNKLKFLKVIKSWKGKNTGKYGGRKATYHNLTLKGLMFALLDKDFWKQNKKGEFWNLERIIRKHNQLLPLIFKKWEFYEENNLKEFVLRRLKLTIRYMARNLLTDILYGIKYLKSILEIDSKYVFIDSKKKKRNWIESELQPPEKTEDTVLWQKFPDIQKLKDLQKTIYNENKQLLLDSFYESFFFGIGVEEALRDKEKKFLVVIYARDKGLKKYIQDYLDKAEQCCNEKLKNIRLAREAFEKQANELSCL